MSVLPTASTPAALAKAPSCAVEMYSTPSCTVVAVTPGTFPGLPTTGFAEGTDPLVPGLTCPVVPAGATPPPVVPDPAEGGRLAAGTGSVPRPPSPEASPPDPEPGPSVLDVDCTCTVDPQAARTTVHATARRA